MLVFFPLFHAFLLTLAFSLGRAKILNCPAGWGGVLCTEHLCFIVLMVFQKHQFICKEFITITLYNMFLQNLLEE